MFHGFGVGEGAGAVEVGGGVSSGGAAGEVAGSGVVRLDGALPDGGMNAPAGAGEGRGSCLTWSMVSRRAGVRAATADGSGVACESAAA